MYSELSRALKLFWQQHHSDQQAAGDFLFIHAVQPRAKRLDLFVQNINAHFLRTAAVRDLRSKSLLPANTSDTAK